MGLKITKSNLSKFYSVILAWIPLLGIYKSFVPGISIGELVLMICGTLSIYFNNRIKPTNAEKTLVVFALYSLFSTMISYMAGLYEFFWFHRLIRILFYIFCICYVSKNLFQECVFFRSMFALSYLLFLGIVIQYIIYYSTGNYLRLYGNILPVMNEELLNLDYQYIIRISVFRPSSLFTEPSHVAQYLMIALTYALYHLKSQNEEKVSIINVIIIGLTMLMSKSLWGYVILLIIFVYWILDSSKEKNSASWYIVLPIVIACGSIALVNSSLFKDTFSRIQFSDLSNSQAFMGRFGGYEILNNLSMLRRIFGTGFAASVVNKPITNSVLLLLYGSGITGTLIFLLFIFFVVKSNNNIFNWKRTLAVSLFVLMFGSNILFSTGIILVCTCIIIYNKTDNSERDNSYGYRNKSAST